MAAALARSVLFGTLADTTDPRPTLDAMQRGYASLADALRSAVGHDGFNALIARAIVLSTDDHPVLTDVFPARTTPGPAEIAAAVERHGAAPVAAALESAIATLADVLAGLVGADMVPNLFEHTVPAARPLTSTEIP
jgi:hypothetical protein